MLWTAQCPGKQVQLTHAIAYDFNLILHPVCIVDALQTNVLSYSHRIPGPFDDRLLRMMTDTTFKVA